MRALLTGWTVAMAFCGCGGATPGILTPATGPGTAYPCGVGEVVCVVQHGCCDPQETCGGEPDAMPGCPPKSCCAIPSDDSLGSRKPPRPQRPWSETPKPWSEAPPPS